MVKRGHEVDLEYSKKEIMDRMNNFFGKKVVEKIKLVQQAFTPAPAVSGVGLGDATATNQELTNETAGGTTVIDASTNTNTSTSGDTLAMSGPPEPAVNTRKQNRG